MLDLIPLRNFVFRLVYQDGIRDFDRAVITDEDVLGPNGMEEMARLVERVVGFGDGFG